MNRPSTKGPRRRAALACQTCHRRKVRCNVTLSGPPCMNCLSDGVECEVVSRGRGARRHRMANLLAGRQRDTPSSGGQTESLSCILPPSPQELPPSSAASGMLRTPESVHVQPSSHDVPNGCSPPESSTGSKQPDHEQEDEDTGYSGILDDADNDKGKTLFYTGDQQGLGLVVDICKPHRGFRGSHFMVPRAAAMSALLSEDLTALNAKGCFSLPSEEVRERLLQCYCHYVHPFLPIIDLSKFLHQYESGGPRKVNLLLLWSMFFASTNFLDDKTVVIAGYTSRKAMKSCLYKRAKALYDADYEKEKIPLIQSVILLAFWYADCEDRDGSWHWIGIAISLCQTIGLHRNPLLGRPGLGRSTPQRLQTPAGPEQSRLWGLIWWASYFRDTWLSFGMGRPTRIDLSDCDTPVPTAEDVRSLSAGVPHNLASKYLPDDENNALPQMWVSLLETTFALGSILNNHYRAKQPDRHSLTTIISEDQNRLRHCCKSFPSEEAHDSPVVLLHLYHLRVYYEACMIALHRPYMAGRPGESDNIQDTWRVQSLQKAKIAASNITSTWNKLSASHMLRSCHAMMVTAMIPTLQIHLLNSVSGDGVAKCLARNQLDNCMIMLRELRPTYWAADFVYLLFSKARRQLDLMPQQDGTVERGSSSRLPEVARPFVPPPTAPDTIRCQAPTASESGGAIPTTPGQSLCAQDQEPDFRVPLDIDLALAYDFYPLHCDYESLGGSWERSRPSSSLAGNRVNSGQTPLQCEEADTDMNVLFEGDDFSEFLL